MKAIVQNHYGGAEALRFDEIARRGSDEGRAHAELSRRRPDGDDAGRRPPVHPLLPAGLFPGMTPRRAAAMMSASQTRTHDGIIKPLTRPVSNRPTTQRDVTSRPTLSSRNQVIEPRPLDLCDKP
jgi:hypothetical protein